MAYHKTDPFRAASTPLHTPPWGCLSPPDGGRGRPKDVFRGIDLFPSLHQKRKDAFFMLYQGEGLCAITVLCPSLSDFDFYLIPYLLGKPLGARPGQGNRRTEQKMAFVFYSPPCWMVTCFLAERALQNAKVADLKVRLQNAVQQHFSAARLEALVKNHDSIRPGC